MSGSLGKSESKNESSSSSFIDPAQQAFLERLFSQGEGLSNQQQQGGSSFQNQVLNPAQDAFQNFLTPQQNPFLQGQIEQGQFAINENLQQNILPSIGSQATQAGQFGGGRQGVAEGIALRDANRTSANFAENLTAQDFQGQQQRAIQALGQANNIGGLAFSPLQNLRALLGGTTVLNQGQSQGDSNSKNAGFGFGG